MKETTAMTTARIAVLGTGAIGASMDADWARAGLDVTFIEQWPAPVGAMHKNGMTIDDVAAIVGPERSIGAVLRIAANINTPGAVERQVPRGGTCITVGTMDGVRTPALAAVVGGLGHAGAISISGDIRASKWMKPPEALTAMTTR